MTGKPERKSVVPAREYEPGYNAEREWQDWSNELRRNRLAQLAKEREEATVTFDVDLSPASPGPAWEWPVNDLGGQDPHPSGGTDENDLDQEVES